MTDSRRLWLWLVAALCSLTMQADDYVVEYFWNSDPGVSKAQMLQAAVKDGQLNVALDVSDARLGFNMLGMRVYNGKVWSTTRTTLVYVPTSVDIDWTLCEYYWDADPGVGAASQIKVDTNGTGAIELPLGVDGLKPGLHSLGVRMTNASGMWSATRTTLVYIKDEAGDEIDAVEYFWGDDPGYSNGTPIDLTPAGVVVIDDLVIELPATEQETSLLTFRAHSKNGGWGICYSKEVSIPTFISDVLGAGDNAVQIYSVQGVLVYEGPTTLIPRLPQGTYVAKYADRTVKLSVRL